MEGALADVLAHRDTQRNEMPVQADSVPVVENDIPVDSNDAHVDGNQMNENEEQHEPTEQMEESFETTEVEESQEETQEPTAEIKEETDAEKQLASSKKQRSDDQSYFQHQINELRAENEKLKATPVEPVKEVTDEELNDLFYENPAEAMRMMNARNQPNPVNQQVAIQEGVQRALHNDYDEVIKVVKQQAMINPQLEQEIMNSPDPAKTAYEKGQAFHKAHQIQVDPVKYEADLRATILAENATQSQSMPTRVGGVRSTAPNVGKASQSDHGKTTFSKMFGKSRR